VKAKEPPRPFSTLIMNVIETDAMTLETRGIQEYYRPYIWGEAWPEDTPKEMASLCAVQVTKTEAGVVRMVWVYDQPPFEKSYVEECLKAAGVVTRPWPPQEN